LEALHEGTAKIRARTRTYRETLYFAALVESGGNISEAARLLNVHRQNLQQKIRLLGIDLASISPVR
jgi:ActR/RegA family two-component response regulator